jgi:UDP-N-acetylglucosamine--N-acetylmuramyl-(pentapeptide) pyrophosphoryl-undecaprenol N-acetylglucosamine transferase
MKKKTVIIAGGGTGGHIYPAVAIARALLEKDPQLDIQFVGSPGGLETKIIPKEGFPLHLIRVGKLNQTGGIFGKMKTLIGIPVALLQSASLLFELRPQFVLGVGGFASGPFVLMAALLGFKSTIWEPNAHPGLTNRWLSFFVRRSLVVFEEAGKLLKSKEIVQIGLPVRREVEDVTISSHDAGKFHLLVFGGSQGARAINNVVKEALIKFPNELKDVEVVHQTGTADFADVKTAYEKWPQFQAFEYLYGMEKYYQWADLVVCRAGASTVAELAACSMPAILIPLPTAADDHQLKNAQSLVDHQAGVLLEQKNLTAESLVEKILLLKTDREKRERIKVNLKKFYIPKAAHRIADYLLSVGERI